MVRSRSIRGRRLYRRRPYRTLYRRRPRLYRRRYTPRRRIYRRRPAARRLRLGPASTQILRGPIPPFLWVKFKYNDYHYLSANLSTPNSIAAFYANNPYDPVVGVSTSTCSGYSMWLQLYERCICFASKIVVRSYIGSNTNTENISYVYSQDHNLRFPNGLTRDQLTEQNSVLRKKQWLSTTYLIQSMPNYHTMSLFAKTKAVEQKRELEPLLYSTTVGGGLASSYATYWIVGTRLAAGLPTSGAECSMRHQITITYYCKLFNPVALDG